jgi:hypothetical protein
LEQENQDLGNKLLETYEENYCLKNLNQKLLEQIRMLKEEKLENPDIKEVDKSENEDLAHLNNYNKNLLMEINKLKNDKSLENKLEQIIEKEASKSSNVKIPVVEKGTNTNPMDITTQKVSNSIGENTYKDVGVQTMELSCVLTNKNAAIDKPVHEEDKTPKVNPKILIGTIKRIHSTKTPYQHPNHESRYINKSEYQHRSEHKQLNRCPKNVDANTIEFHNNNYLGNHISATFHKGSN